MDDMTPRVWPNFVPAPSVFGITAGFRITNGVMLALTIGMAVLMSLDPMGLHHPSQLFLLLLSVPVLATWGYLALTRGWLFMLLMFVMLASVIATLGPSASGAPRQPVSLFVTGGLQTVIFAYCAFAYKAFVILDERGVVLSRMIGTLIIPWNEVVASDVRWGGGRGNLGMKLVIDTVTRRYEVSSEFDIRAIQEMINSRRSAQVFEGRPQKPPLDGLGGGTGDIGL